MSEEGFGPVTVITADGTGTGRLMDDDTIVMDRHPEEVVVTPHWPNVLRYFAEGLRSHSFDRGATEPIISFIEMVRYCQQTDPAELEVILTELRESAASRAPLGGIEQYQDEDR